mmetsp:Transcript_13524/g.35461  ORF Transcript_13524/g.35461 Transcript_13524/m.35461 type:complete len:263 (-) Transcript_13524:16-804(-)
MWRRLDLMAFLMDSMLLYLVMLYVRVSDRKEGRRRGRRRGWQRGWRRRWQGRGGDGGYAAITRERASLARPLRASCSMRRAQLLGRTVCVGLRHLVFRFENEVQRLPRPEHVDARADLLADGVREVENRLVAVPLRPVHVKRIEDKRRHRDAELVHQHALDAQQQPALNEVAQVGDEPAIEVLFLAVSLDPVKLRPLQELTLDALRLHVERVKVCTPRTEPIAVRECDGHQVLRLGLRHTCGAHDPLQHAICAIALRHVLCK